MRVERKAGDNPCHRVGRSGNLTLDVGESRAERRPTRIGSGDSSQGQGGNIALVGGNGTCGGTVSVIAGDGTEAGWRRTSGARPVVKGGRVHYRCK